MVASGIKQTELREWIKNVEMPLSLNVDQLPSLPQQDFLLDDDITLNKLVTKLEHASFDEVTIIHTYHGCLNE
jgi:hypothetical protein